MPDFQDMTSIVLSMIFFSLLKKEIYVQQVATTIIQWEEDARFISTYIYAVGQQWHEIRGKTRVFPLISCHCWPTAYM